MDTTFNKFQDFRNDAEKRDFVACGAAAGVAAAFGAPIGGVLFSLEEGSSFWSTKLTWRAFFCAMVTVFTLYVANTARSMFGHSEKGAMFSFGEFYSLRGEQSNYSVWELALFMGMGLLGGLIGAYFNTCVMMIFKWRAENVRSRTLKLVEVLVVVALMSAIALGSPLMWHKCTPLPVVTAEWSDQERRLVADLVPLYCNRKTHYNELASLYLADSDVVIRQLFHFKEVGDQNDLTFSSASLFLFFVPYLIMACVTYGTAVPAGMFVPSLTSGAAFGRLAGHLLHTFDNTRGTFADSGTYALMGAIAVTGGIARMVSALCDFSPVFPVIIHFALDLFADDFPNGDGAGGDGRYAVRAAADADRDDCAVDRQPLHRGHLRHAHPHAPAELPRRGREREQAGAAARPHGERHHDQEAILHAAGHARRRVPRYFDQSEAQLLSCW